MSETNTESSTAKIVEEIIQEEVHCPHCAGKLSGVINGKRDTCPYDDCKKSFTIRI